MRQNSEGAPWNSGHVAQAEGRVREPAAARDDRRQAAAGVRGQPVPAAAWNHITPLHDAARCFMNCSHRPIVLILLPENTQDQAKTDLQHDKLTLRRRYSILPNRWISQAIKA